MAAAPTILDTPQLDTRPLGVSAALDDATWLRSCEQRGRLAILLEGPFENATDPAHSSALLQALTYGIEAHLLRLGASPGSTPVGASVHAQLSDQVYRARLLGYEGLALVVPSLHAFSVRNVLSPNDSWALLEFCEAARELRIDLRFSRNDARLELIPRPVAFDELVPGVCAPVPTQAGEASGVCAVTPTPPPESAAHKTTSNGAKEREPASATAARSMRAAMQDLLKDELGNLDDVETPIPGKGAPVPTHASLPSKPDPALPPPRAITPTPQPTPVFEASSASKAEKLMRELETTDGTCGWDEIEQRFVESYLPLQQLLPSLANPTNADRALVQWASAFAESYRTAFEALRNNRGKRPRLVLDVPSHAFQLSRKLEIEQHKMVLVDAMRADLAPIVLDKLRLQMTHTAECVAEGLLWSALPSTTAAQMELIARGTDSLRHFTGELSEDQLLSRGNDLRRLRPVRVGSHRMYKLDIVQYLTRDTNSHDRPKLEQYAAEIATSVGRFLRQQGPNTLVYVFGDHGFGGACEASPENVLVPYFAWRLLG